MFIDLDGVEE